MLAIAQLIRLLLISSVTHSVILITRRRFLRERLETPTSVQFSLTRRAVSNPNGFSPLSPRCREDLPLLETTIASTRRLLLLPILSQGAPPYVRFPEIHPWFHTASPVPHGRAHAGRHLKRISQHLLRKEPSILDPPFFPRLSLCLFVTTKTMDPLPLFPFYS